jgi:ribosome-binding protein aMBF1 (putative translation factor)
MKKISTLHNTWLKEDAYRKEYEALEREFNLASAIIEARARAGLTQEELAAKMQTTQSTIARMESGKSLPSSRTLEKLAKATGSRLKIVFEAMPKPTKAKAA